MLFSALSIEGPDLNFVNCVSFRSHLNAYMKKVAMIYKDYEICVFFFSSVLYFALLDVKNSIW